MIDYETNDAAELEESTTAKEPENPTPSQRLRLFWIAAVVIVLDQFSKLIIESTLPLYQSWAPIPAIASLFRISHVSNTGMAFGLFPAGSSIFAWTPILVSLAIIVYNYFLPAGQNGLRLALAFQLGGAIGNWIDRVRLGHVTDFLDFGPWPVFNLADLSVVTGALLLAWIFWQEERQQKAAEASLSELPSAEESPGERMDGPAMIDEWSAN